MGFVNRRLSINIIAQIVTFAVQAAISFLLTPFVVNRLGAESYGFIGLADNFVLYAQLLVQALNSMANRFIAISYYKNNIDDVNELFSSVFFSNLFICSIILIGSLFCVGYLEYLIIIPVKYLFDVKLLFFLVFVNLLVSVLFSTFQAATFIKNRLELNAIRSIIANIWKVAVLIISFGLFLPHLWYVGMAAILSSIYIAATNIRYTKKLTPDVKIEYSRFRLSKVKLLISSGIWNTLTRLGNILGENLDLLLSNLFISVIAMSNLAVAKKLPAIILSLIASISFAFAPSLTKIYATNNINDLKGELVFSVKVSGMLAVIPMCFLYALSDRFYDLWVPSMDSSELYFITILSTLAMPILLSMESAQNIFVITNKVRGYSIFTLLLNLLNFISLLFVIYITPQHSRLYYMVGSLSFWALIRGTVFLPVYSAKCIHERKSFFLPVIMKVLSSFVLSVFVLLIIKNFIIIQNSWFSLSLLCLILMLVCTLLSWVIILNSRERQKVWDLIYGFTRKYI